MAYQISNKQISELRERTRTELRSIFPQTLNLTRAELATVLNVSVGHIANVESTFHKPLVQPIKIGKKVLYPVIDVIDFLVSQRLNTLKVKVGRPTKASKMAALEEDA